MLMKYLVIFALIFLSGCQALWDTESQEEEALEAVSSQIDYFRDNFKRIMKHFLSGQHPSVAGPVREFADCIYHNHSETLKTAVVTLATAVIKNQSLEEREKLCQPPQTQVIFDLYSCADQIQPSTEFTEIFHSMIYLPFRMVFTQEMAKYSPKTFVAFKNCTECPEIIMKLSEIITKNREAEKEDACLPIQFAKAFRNVFASESPELENIDLDMIQELVRFYITLQAKLPFASYVDCYQLN
uniref:Uncharacterized protein n=1 Tax=Panagrolaimus sp. PS1159 TaxID=55785 RepID=A0AC35FLZ4_9BILA